MPDCPEPDDGEVFDFIVVGSGAGGGTVAARLAENGMRVLVLEAGGDPLVEAPDDYQVPAFHPFASENPAIAWDFFVRHYDDPEQAAKDWKLRPGGIFYPRASALGGCTAHNALITLWPADADWDGIATLTGDESWRGKEMRCYVKRIEDCRHRPLWRFLARFGIDPTAHGWDGWLPTERAMPPQVWGDRKLIFAILLQSLRLELGESHILKRLWRLLLGRLDPNDRRILESGETGLCYTPLSTDRGSRYGTRERLRTVETSSRGKLKIKLNALATRVLFDGQHACGVEYLKGAKLYRAAPGASGAGVPARALCRGEVILAGGTFNTPQLLMLSGIGDPAELAAHGIETRAALPGVGKNLQDRYEVSVITRMARDWRVLAGARFKRGDPLFAEWDTQPRGGMYVSNGAMLGYTGRSYAHVKEPDLFSMALLAKFDGYVPGYSQEIATHHDALSWTILKAHTGNRSGRVRLRSADPRDVPDIDFNSFGEGGEADLDAVVRAVQAVRRILAPLTGWNLAAEETTPGTDIDTREKIADWVRNTAWGHHACGTAAIGPVADNGVLDGRLRVHGVTGLRVVDAAIFPRIPGFFIAGAIFLAAEKAADMILADRHQVSGC